MTLTTIQWTQRRLADGRQLPGYTFNPWWGCQKVSPECTHCYAEAIAARYAEQRVWGPPATTSRRLFGEQHWQEPLGWNAQAAREGHRRAVFCASMADVFEDHPQVAPAREQLWRLIEATPWLNWLLLTKRPEQMARLSPWGGSPWPDNVWLGTSVGLQRYAAPRLSALLSLMCVVHFVSCEPLLEPLDLTPWLPGLQWVICGGESGPKARPMWHAWARSLREQCSMADVPFFFKQWGGRTHSAGGRLLDGRTWDELPPEVPMQSQAREPADPKAEAVPEAQSEGAAP